MPRLLIPLWLLGLTAWGASGRLVTIPELRQMSREEAERGLAVVLEGNMLRRKADLARFSLWQPGGMVRVAMSAQSDEAAPTERIRLEARTFWGRTGLELREIRSMRTGTRREPLPRTVELNRLALQRDLDFVKTTGRLIAAATTGSGQWLMVLGEGRTRILVKTDNAKLFPRLDDLYEVQGEVAQEPVHLHGADPVTVIMSEEITCIGRARAEQAPVRVAVRDLLKSASARLEGRRVELRGKVRSLVSGDLELNDGTGRIGVKPGLLRPLVSFAEAEVSGLVERAGGSWRIVDPSFRPGAARSGAAPRPAFLTTVRQIERLRPEQLYSPERAARPRVALEAMVTYVDPASYLLFVADHTGGSYVLTQPDDAMQGWRAGDWLELRGVAAAGRLLPVVEPESTRVIRHHRLGGAVPVAPKTVDYRDLVNGVYDAEWVEVQGVMRTGTAELELRHSRQLHTDRRGRPALWIEMGAGMLPVFVRKPPGREEVAAWQGRRVRVRAVAASSATAGGQFMGVELLVMDGSQIRVLNESGAAEPEPLAIDMLPRWVQAGGPPSRVKLTGWVNYDSREGYVFLQDDTGGVELFDLTNRRYRLNERVEVTGEASHDGFAPVVRVRDVRATGERVEPAVLTVAPGDFLQTNLDRRLIRIEGEVVEDWTPAKGGRILLRHGPDAFEAQVDLAGGGAPAWPGLEKGAVVSVMGVCLRTWSRERRGLDPARFLVQLRTPDDVRILRAAPFWNTRRMFLGLGALCAISASVSVGALFLLRRVRRQRRELMMAKQTAERASRVRTEFLANMSHEIRTPMNGVLGMTALALETGLAAEPRGYVQMAHDSASALLTIINDILDFSKVDAGKLHLEHIPFSLGELVAQTARTVAPTAFEKGLDFGCWLSPQLPLRVMGDPHRVRQVIINLASNAVKFTAAGEVEIQAVCRERRLSPQGLPQARIDFSVRDTGIGIPPEKHAQIFESFTQADGSVTREFGGTGLGLTISRKLVELMGGQMTLESEPGQGSTFSFSCWFDVPADQSAVVQLVRALPLAGQRLWLDVPRGLTARIARQEIEALGVEVVGTEPDGRPLDLAVDLAVLAGGDEHLRAALEALRSRGGRPVKVVVLAEPARLSSLEWTRREYGVTAVLMLPALREELAAALTGDAQEAPVAAKTALTPERPLAILVAEDNLVNQKLVTRILEIAGYRVTIASHGRMALDLLASHAFDAVLMDVQMPVMDGIDAMRAMRARGDRTPVVALTAHAMAEDRERCLAAGADEYLSKPLRAEELLKVIGRLTSDARNAAPGRPITSWSTTRPAGGACSSTKTAR